VRREQAVSTDGCNSVALGLLARNSGRWSASGRELWGSGVAG